MKWITAITDRAGATRAFVLPSGLAITRRMNSYADLTFTLPESTAGDAVKAQEVATSERAVAVWRQLTPEDSATIFFRGQITSPSDALGDDSASVTVNAADPFWWLQHRFVRAEVTYTAQDAGAIAWDLVSLQEGYETIHLQDGTIDVSVDRDRTYAAGKQVAEAITQLSEVEEGFWFRIRPVDGGGAVFGELEVLYPDSGSTATEASFEYGEGTRGTIENVPSVEELPPVNRVVAFGDQITASAEDATSIDRYGLVERSVSFPDVNVQATLDAHAAEELRPNPIRTYTFRATPTPGSNAPVLGVDFDIGDIVPVKIDSWRVSLEASCRVLAATVTISDDAESEQLTNVVVEEV